MDVLVLWAIGACTSLYMNSKSNPATEGFCTDARRHHCSTLTCLWRTEAVPCASGRTAHRLPFVNPGHSRAVGAAKPARRQRPRSRRRGDREPARLLGWLTIYLRNGREGHRGRPTAGPHQSPWAFQGGVLIASTSAQVRDSPKILIAFAAFVADIVTILQARPDASRHHRTPQRGRSRCQHQQTTA